MLSLTVTKPVSDQRLEQQKTHILMVGTATYLVVQYIKKKKNDDICSFLLLHIYSKARGWVILGYLYQLNQVHLKK